MARRNSIRKIGGYSRAEILNLVVFLGMALQANCFVFVESARAQTTSSTALGPSQFSYEGRVYDISGYPSLQKNVRFKIQVLNPSVNGVPDCVLRDELSPAVDLSATNGYFAVTLGHVENTAVYLASGVTLGQIFSNTTSTLSGDGGCSYVPASGHTRRVRISVIEGSTVTPMTPDITVGSAPYAMNADRLGGRAASEFLRASGSLTQTNLEKIFSSSTRVDELDSLISGTSTKYLRAHETAGAVLAGAPASPVAGSVWYESGTIRFFNGASVVSVGASGGSTTGQTGGTGSTSFPSGSANGQALVWSGSQYSPRFLTMADLRSSDSVSSVLPASSCLNNQALSWSSLTDSFVCSTIQVSASAVEGLGSAALKDVGQGPGNLVELDQYGKIPASLLPFSPDSSGSTNGLITQVNGNVGIDTTYPMAQLHIGGDINYYDAQLLIQPNVMWGGAVSRLRFADPDYGTPPFDIEYADVGVGTNGLSSLGFMGHVGIGYHQGRGNGVIRYDANLDLTGSVRWRNSYGAFVGFRAPVDASDVTWTLPAADGPAGSVLSTNGLGQLTWIAPGTYGGGTDSTWYQGGLMQVGSYSNGYSSSTFVVPNSCEQWSPWVFNVTSGVWAPEPGAWGCGDEWYMVSYPRSPGGEDRTLEIAMKNDVDDHIALMPSGNVGIGTNNPQDKLDVQGKIRATHICAPDGSNCRDLSTPWYSTPSSGTTTSTVWTFSGPFVCGASEIDFSFAQVIRLSPSNVITPSVSGEPCFLPVKNLVPGARYTLVVTGNAAVNPVMYRFGPGGGFNYAFKHTPMSTQPASNTDTIWELFFDGTTVYAKWSAGFQ